MPNFSAQVLHWYDQHGRKHLPWQQAINPYRVWISEIMLQQTQVQTVIPYYERFMQTFPTLEALARAEQDRVLNHWSGLGYYARARNLHATAKLLCADHEGKFPTQLTDMQALPGIGRSTAAAILSIVYDQKEAILDGNVKRVLSRYHAISGWPGKTAVQKELWKIAENSLPNERFGDYTQAMMDLGATLCTRTKPACERCPLRDDCQGYQQGDPLRYPGKKPKKKLPEKQAVMLIIQDNCHVYMQKRPPTGIWGSLWCFPEFETHQKAQQWLQQFAPDAAIVVSKLPVLSHTFSHFKLHIEPLIIALETPIKLSVMEKGDALWYNINTEFSGGLATPVLKLINQLKDQQHGTNGKLRKTG